MTIDELKEAVEREGGELILCGSVPIVKGPKNKRPVFNAMVDEYMRAWAIEKMKHAGPKAEKQAEQEGPPAKKRRWKLFFSKAIGERFIAFEDGRVKFECGLWYTWEEVQRLQGLDETDIRRLHNAKKVLSMANIDNKQFYPDFAEVL
jgi:hypothetical protein